MKWLKNNWISIVIILIIFFGFGIYRNIRQDKFIDHWTKDSEKKILIIEEINLELEKDKNLLIEQKLIIQTSKDDVLKKLGVKINDIAKLNSDLKKKPKIEIRIVETFKTIEVEKIIYVKKDDCLKLQEKFSGYINLDINLKCIVDKIIDTGKTIDDGKDKIISTLKEDKKRLLKILNGWNLSYGVGGTIGYPSSSFGLTISYSKILVLKKH